MMSDELSIVIPVFNKWNFTQACLKDLEGLDTSKHEIIIVDNASSDETAKSIVDMNLPNLKYHKNETNLGFARGCNIGYSLASFDNVMFLNNDIRVKADKGNWTSKVIERCPEGLVGPTMGQLDSKLQFVKESNCVLPGNSYLSGWCIAASKSIWSKLELPRTGLMSMNGNAPQIFSEEFGLAYFEDTDLGFRAKKLGVPMHVVDVPVVHFGKQSSSQINTYALYTSARSIFVKKWANRTA